MVINPKVVDYIQHYISQGYSIDKIKQFLLANNISEKDIDDAINYINSNTGSNLVINPALELQLRNYIQTQLNSGYNIDLIKNALVSQGFSPNIVNKVVSDLNNVNINVKHEVNISKGTIIGIVASIFIVAVVVFGLFNLNMFSTKESLLDIAINTNAYSFMAGETVSYQLHITNMGSESRFDATIKYLVVDDADSIITRKEETIAVQTTASVTRTIQLPQNIKPGKYYLRAIADYGSNKQAKSSAEFEVVQKVTEKKPITYVPPANNQNPGTGTKPGGTVTRNTSQTFGDVLINVRQIAQTNGEIASANCARLVNDQKDICYSVVADSSQQIYYCDRITGATYKDNCYLAFVMKGNVDVCDKISDNSSKEFCNQLRIVQLMNKYYKENNTEKILELSKQFNPNVYNSNPTVPTYEQVYTEPVTIMDIINTGNETNSSG